MPQRDEHPACDSGPQLGECPVRDLEPRCDERLACDSESQHNGRSGRGLELGRPANECEGPVGDTLRY